MTTEPAPQRDAGRDIVDKIRELTHDMDSATQVIFVAQQDAQSPDGKSADIVEQAQRIATEVGLNRWAGWGVAWVRDDAGFTYSSDSLQTERGLPSLTTVIDDLVDTGRSAGIVLCAIGALRDSAEANAVLSKGVEHAAQRGLNAQVVN